MRIGLLGTGILGFAVAQRLLSEQHSLNVYNRTSEKSAHLKKFGANISNSSAELINQSDIILLFLSDEKAIRDTVLSVSPTDLKNKIFIQMGTISSVQSRAFNKSFDSFNALYAECPVLGSRNEALAGTLLLMFAGEKKIYKKCLVVLESLGKDIYFTGHIGSAAVVKLALNHLIASHALNFSLSLGLIESNHGDKDQFMAILKKSALMAPMFEKKLKNWTTHNYDNPNFPLKHLQKDIALVLKEAESKNLETSLIETMQTIISKGTLSGLSDCDYSSVYELMNPSKGKK